MINISAAPDMYKALRQVIAYLSNRETWQEDEYILYDQILTALAKADGGTPNEKQIHS